MCNVEVFSLESLLLVHLIWTINFGFSSTALSFFLFQSANMGPFFHFQAFQSQFRGWGQVQTLNFLGPSGLFWGANFQLGSGLTTYLRPTYVDYQFGFQKQSPIFSFFIWSHFGLFFHLLGPLGLFLGLESGPNTFLGPSYIDT